MQRRYRVIATPDPAGHARDMNGVGRTPRDAGVAATVAGSRDGPPRALVAPMHRGFTRGARPSAIAAWLDEVLGAHEAVAG